MSYDGRVNQTEGASSGLTRRQMLRLVGAGAAGLAAMPSWLSASAASANRPPNFVIIFTDDQGYADLGCFGAEKIKTPRLDRMAAEGAKFTDFYVTAPSCTPSRASLMTGCYAQRVSLPRVIDHSSRIGIHADELTLAELLKTRGYATACIGKWHLGWQAKFLPTRHGFDSYYGIPYSNDMKPSMLMRNEQVIEQPVEQDTLTRRYTAEAIRFITEHKDQPFFLYLAHSMPHVPLHVSKPFRGRSAGGLYGDVIEEIDWGCGQILDTLGQLALDDQTLVVFTSDNGPWLARRGHGGSAKPLRGGKTTCYEGGMRVPCIMCWPGHIRPATVCSEVAATIDLLPTFAKLAGARIRAGRVIDGKDIWPLMRAVRGATSPHEAFFYYRHAELRAVRSGRWKLMFPHRAARGEPRPKRPVLYDLQTDIGETKDVAAEHPDVVGRLGVLADRCRRDLGDGLTGRKGGNIRPCGRI